MALEGDAIRIHLAQARKRHDLKAAGIRQDRSVPIHEAMQATKPRDTFSARPQHKVIGIAEHHARTGGAHRIRGHGLYRTSGANGHENGRWYFAMGGVQHPCPRRAILCFVLPGKSHGVTSVRNSKDESP